MRLRILVAGCALLLALAAMAGTGFARSHPRSQHYTGRAGAGDAYRMSFTVSGGRVRRFTFVSRCAGTRDGVTVPASIRIVRGHFSYRTSEYTVTGRFLAGGRARGTERHRTGDCDSGLLTWAARR